MNERAVVQAALDALEAGDVRGAELILLDVLDAAPETLPHKCDGCGRRFEWPGLLEAHRFLCVHLFDEDTL
jgi:hypothetical protein